MQTPTFSTVLRLLPTASLLPATLASAFTPGCARPPELSVRLPPYLDPALNACNTSSPSTTARSSWPSPPINFMTGTWYLTNSSRAEYRTFSNLQWDLWPVIPSCPQNTTTGCPPGTIAGILNEITTWVPSDNKTARYGGIGGGGRSVASIRAFNTPRRLNFPDLNSDWDAVFENAITEGVPAGWGQTWSVIYWGLDADGLPFMVVHEAPGTLNTGEQGPPCVNVIATNSASPSAASLADVLTAFVDLGNADLSKLIEGVGPVNWDYSLQGGPAICGVQCLGNNPD